MLYLPYTFVYTIYVYSIKSKVAHTVGFMSNIVTEDICTFTWPL